MKVKSIYFFLIAYVSLSVSTFIASSTTPAEKAILFALINGFTALAYILKESLE